MFGDRNFLGYLTFLVLSFHSVKSLSTIQKGDHIESERILSRKRRYLIFPAGSSIQLVYDSTITVPDYTLYVTTGITVALAWGLPDKPTYPELELMEKYENGALPLLEHRKDKNVTASDHKGEIPTYNRTSNLENYYKQSDFSNYIRNYYEYLKNRRKTDSYYFGHKPSSNKYCSDKNCAYNHKISYQTSISDRNKSNGFLNVQPPYSPSYNSSKHYDPFTNYMVEKYFKPWIETDYYKAKYTTTTSKPSKTTTTEHKPIINKLHTVYPAMGKRSILNPKASYAEKFYLDHHRNTRHELYKIIEKYLFAKNLNGTACVLKTLCEMGEKRHENEPGSFLAEIVRAIFSLPTAQLHHVVNKRHIEYDEAHHTENCTAKFEHCPDSVWDAGFLIETDDIIPKFNVQNLKK